MHCLDCLIDGDEGDAVAVCHCCGAGVCGQHAAVLSVHLVRLGAILREERVDPAAREVLCPTCLAARQSALSRHQRPERHRPATRNGASDPEPVGRSRVGTPRR